MDRIRVALMLLALVGGTGASLGFAAADFVIAGAMALLATPLLTTWING